jgi:hypothetical protein
MNGIINDVNSSDKNINAIKINTEPLLALDASNHRFRNNAKKIK